MTESDDTSHPEVDAALAALADLDTLGVHEHVAVYEQVHRRLQDALSRLDGRESEQ